MTNIIKTTLLSLSMLLGLTFMAAQPVHAALFDASKQAACKGVESPDCKGGEATLDKAISNIVNLLSIVIGIAAVVVIIIGGLRYITAGGDSNSINTAKNTILYALVGLVIAVLAQVVVKFVLTKV